MKAIETLSHSSILKPFDKEENLKVLKLRDIPTDMEI